VCTRVNGVKNLVYTIQPAVSCKQTSNRLNVCIHDTADNRFDNRVERTATVIQPVVKPGCTTGLTTGCIV